MTAWRHHLVRLPHRPPMRLIDDHARWDGETLRCRATLERTSPFAREGGVPSSICVELIAQAAGAALAGPAAREGHLVAVRALHLELDTLPFDAPLEVAVRVERGDGVAAATGEVSLDARRVASARITLRLGGS